MKQRKIVKSPCIALCSNALNTKNERWVYNDIFDSKTWCKLMEYERYHLVNLFKEVVKNAGPYLYIVSFHKSKEEK